MPTFSGPLRAPADFPQDLYDYTTESDGLRTFKYELEVMREGSQVFGYLGLIKSNAVSSFQKYALIKSPILETVSHDNADHYAFELLELFISGFQKI